MKAIKLNFWITVFLSTFVVAACKSDSGSNSEEGSTVSSHGGERPSEEGEGIPGYLTFSVDPVTNVKTQLAGDGSSNNPAVISLASGGTSYVIFTTDPAFETLACYDAPEWVSYDNATNTMTIAPPSDTATSTISFYCSDDEGRGLFAQLDIKGGSDGVTFNETSSLNLASLQTIHSVANQVTITGTSEGDLESSSLQLSLKRSSSGLCLNEAQTAFDATCPQYHSVTSSESWSWVLADSLFTHRESYEVTGSLATATETSGVQEQQFLYKLAVGATVYDILYDQGTNKIENARSLAIDNTNGVFYVVGQATDSVAASSGFDYLLKKYAFGGAEVTSGNWGSLVQYAPDSGNTEVDYPVHLLYESTTDSVFISGDIVNPIGIGSHSIKQYLADGSAGWEDDNTSFPASTGNSSFVYGGDIYHCISHRNQAAAGTSHDFMIHKYNLTGTEDLVGWPYVGLNTSAGVDDRCHDIYIDATGIYTLGHNNDRGDVVVSHFSFAGVRETAWSDLVIANGGPGQNGYWRMVHHDGFLYIAGYGQNLTGGGAFLDGFVRKINKTTGTEVTTGGWPKLIHTGNSDQLRGIIYHPYADRIIVAGFGQNLVSGGSGDDIFVQAYATDGTVDASLSFSINGQRDDEDRADYIAQDESGDIYIVGKMTNEVSATSDGDWFVRVISGPGPQ